MQFLFRLKYVLLFIIIRYARAVLAIHVCGIFLINTAVETLCLQRRDRIVKDRITSYDIFEIDSNLPISV